MSSLIPIQNVYYLLCYAWDVLPEQEAVNIDSTTIDKPIDLLCAVLVNGTKHLLRRGIDQGYQPYCEELSTIRGRINVALTARRFLLQQGKAQCEYDELTVNTLPNQILKGVFNLLTRTWGLDKKLRHEATMLARQFRDVDNVRPNKQLFRRVQLHGNNRFYKFLLNICELILDESLLDEVTGKYKFKDFVRDDKRMARLYEKFLFNFYKKEQKKYRVSSERIRWQATSKDDPSLDYLPSMLTDISLRNTDKTLIIDAKYYSRTLQSNYDATTVHSGNLYQIYSYLKNLETRGGADAQAEGLLLYPTVEAELSKSYMIDTHVVRIETVDLSKDWQLISNRLLDIIH